MANKQRQTTNEANTKDQARDEEKWRKDKDSQNEKECGEDKEEWG